MKILNRLLKTIILFILLIDLVFKVAGQCTPTVAGPQPGLNLGIKRVTLKTINRVSATEEGYVDATAMKATIGRGQYTNLTIQTGITGQTTGVYVDFNHNGTFDFSSSEEVFFQEVNDTIISVPITIPLNAPKGYVRLRVFSWDGSFTSPCFAFCGFQIADCLHPLRYGDIEDYTINITDTVVTA